jgi:dihydrofolate reductase
MSKTDITISAIVAHAENRVIGKDNKMPWHLPADLKHFKEITTGHPILMGRKTFESIGKPLPNRTNLILTRDTLFIAPEGTIVVHSLEAALQEVRKIAASQLFIIGGAQLYEQFLPNIQKLYLTLIHHPFEGDTFFPKLNEAEWETIAEEHHESDEKNAFAYHFKTLQRREP